MPDKKIKKTVRITREEYGDLQRKSPPRVKQLDVVGDLLTHWLVANGRKSPAELDSLEPVPSDDSVRTVEVRARESVVDHAFEVRDRCRMDRKGPTSFSAVVRLAIREGSV